MTESTRPGTLSETYFDDLYEHAADPWGLESGWYEDRKRACVMAALPASRFRRGFEPGCANGALSVLLADRIDQLICWDPSARAVATTRGRLERWPGVRVEQNAVPAAWPPGRFDLIVASEVVYYLDTADRSSFWDAAERSLQPGGTLVAVHWIRPAPEYPVEGDQVHEELGRRPGLTRTVNHIEADFRLDVLTRVPPPARSVAGVELAAPVAPSGTVVPR